MHEFIETKHSGEWISFSSDLAVKVNSGKLTTNELCLYSKELSTVRALAEFYPDELIELLAGKPETVEFSNGSGAVRFFVKDGSQITNVLSLNHLRTLNFPVNRDSSVVSSCQ